jgi:predicted phage-related endonuclease
VKERSAAASFPFSLSKLLHEIFMLDTTPVPGFTPEQARDYVNDVFGKRCNILPAPTTNEAFLAHRRRGMGGTDSATVAGLVPKSWGSLLSLYASKVSSVPEKKPNSLIMEIGNALENFVIDKAVAKIAQDYQTEVKLVARSLYLSEKEEPIVLGSLDACVDVGGFPMIVDAKTTRDYEEGSLRANYWAQLVHYMGMSGIPRACLVTLDVANGSLHTHYLTLDEDETKAWGYMREGDLKFWKDHVTKRTAPPADPEYAVVDQEAIYRLYPVQVPGKVIRLPDSFVAHCKRLEVITSEIKQLEQEKDAIKLQVTEAMGDAEYGYLVNGDAFTYRSFQRKGYYVEPTEGRTLRQSTIEACDKARQKAAKGPTAPKAKRKPKADEDDTV